MAMQNQKNLLMEVVKRFFGYVQKGIHTVLRLKKEPEKIDQQVAQNVSVRNTKGVE